MKYFVILIASILTYSSEAKIPIIPKKFIKVAVIDTGINLNVKVPLCETGHKSFVPNEGLEDNIGHGSNISGLIDENAHSDAYCQIIIKYYSSDGEENLNASAEAFQYALTLNVDIINYSSGGYGTSVLEHTSIQKALKKGITVVVAAGNDGKNLDKECDVYPACYPEKDIVVVGNVSKYSNYGKIVDLYVNGNNKHSGGYTMSGTSQSTAIVTGRIIRKSLLSSKGSVTHIPYKRNTFSP